MYCIFCGQQLPIEAHYCSKCGKQVYKASDTPHKEKLEQNVSGGWPAPQNDEASVLYYERVIESVDTHIKEAVSDFLGIEADSDAPIIRPISPREKDNSLVWSFPYNGERWEIVVSVREQRYLDSKNKEGIFYQPSYGVERIRESYRGEVIWCDGVWQSVDEKDLQGINWDNSKRLSWTKEVYEECKGRNFGVSYRWLRCSLQRAKHQDKVKNLLSQLFNRSGAEGIYSGSISEAIGDPDKEAAIWIMTYSHRWNSWREDTLRVALLFSDEVNKNSEKFQVAFSKTMVNTYTIDTSRNELKKAIERATHLSLQ